MCIRDSSWRHNVMSTHDMRRGVMPPDEEGNPLTRPEMEEADLSPEPRAPTSELPPIDVKLARYPCCIVWTPLPLITFLCPVIGHIGICDAAGHIYDFGGGVHVDQFMFGDVARYIQLDPAMVRDGLCCHRAESRQCIQPASVMIQISQCHDLSLIHISEPTRLLSISYAVFCLKKKKKTTHTDAISLSHVTA
eukprot:TRINITY_DN13571_c0_g1_i1.p1 TRINITY_DN13571_c0_g1~~TRINITY_DN13571_c0_g1_i1.p1  ORF type:complete len:193 (-),score=37.42 TRINITY_DN13571_c0_g1_i1:12-590(-)